MYCGKCGSTIPDDDVFCSVCGAPIRKASTQSAEKTETQPEQEVSVVTAAKQSEPINRRNGMATTGLVFGILATVFSVVLFIGENSRSSVVGFSLFLVYSFAILGVIFSPIGMAKSRRSGGKRKASVGLFLSICGFLLPVLMLGIGTYTYKADASSSTNSNGRTINVDSNKLEELLAAQPVYASGTRYIVQDPDYKSLYPDLLHTDIVNNSGTDVKDVVIAFVAWDENNLPVKIKGEFDYSGGNYVKQCNFSGVNLISGGKYEKNGGYAIDTGLNIVKFKAILYKYETFDGTVWINPYYEAWEKMYGGNKLTNDLRVDVELTESDYNKMKKA